MNDFIFVKSSSFLSRHIVVGLFVGKGGGVRADNPAPLPLLSLWLGIPLTGCIALLLSLQLRHKDFEISAIREELELSSQELAEQVLNHFSWQL